MRHGSSILVLGLAVCWLFVCVGCSNDVPVADVPEPTGSENAPSDDAAPTGDSTAGTVNTPVSIARDASPEDVVVAFLEALNMGTSETIGGLLTQAARKDTAREGYKPAPLGPDGTKYNVGKTEYVSELGDQAHVACDWTETDAQGYTMEFQVTWLLKIEKGLGWRIYGLAAHDDLDNVIVFNFENATDMRKKLQAATGDSGVRQAGLVEELPEAN